MIKVQTPNFSVGQICESGQCFRMAPTEGNQYELIALGRHLKLEEHEDHTVFHCTAEEFDQVWYPYFDLDTDYQAHISSIDPHDTYLNTAAEYGKGIRILRQDTWEMIITFIISQQNNIKRIRKCIDTICRQYGILQLTKAGETYYTFPTPESLLKATEEDLRACGLGYRSRYIVNTTQSISESSCTLSELISTPYPQSKQELMKLSGIGSKVADCICLFALHQLEAFPEDTHILKVLAANYPDGFPHSSYPGYAGILQQYIFYYDLTQNIPQPSHL